jgi:hypothetical protein
MGSRKPSGKMIADNPNFIPYDFNSATNYKNDLGIRTVVPSAPANNKEDFAMAGIAPSVRRRSRISRLIVSFGVLMVIVGLAFGFYFDEITEFIDELINPVGTYESTSMYLCRYSYPI